MAFSMRHDGFYELVLEGPGKGSLGTAMMQSVLARLDEAGGEPVLFSGVGDAFSAGLNLKEIASLDPGGMTRFVELVEELMARIYDHPGPTVACVNGHAIAGGCVIALCADVRIASDDPKIRIGLNEVALGLELPPKIMKLARHRLARHQVERVLLEAGLHEPRRAAELGLVDEVVADPATRARAVLDVLAGHPPTIYAATKRTLRGGAIELAEADRRYFRDEVLSRWTAPAVKEKALATLKR